MAVLCKFGKNNLNLYFCHINEQKIPLVVSAKTFHGEHQESKTNKDVFYLLLTDAIISEIPFDLGNVFSNLIWLKVQDCNLKMIFKENLQQFPHLTQLDVGNNKIKYLPGDLFEFNKKLSYISFYRNSIKFIGSKLFDGLLKLKYVDLTGNIKFNFLYQRDGPKTLEMLKLKFKKTRKPNFKVKKRKICQKESGKRLKNKNRKFGLIWNELMDFKLSAKVQKNKNHQNELDQLKLNSQMEIIGLAVPASADFDTLRLIFLNYTKTIDIKIKSNAIVDVSIRARTMRGEKILIVTFKNEIVKNKVIKQKIQHNIKSGNISNIYFNHVLTPENHQLYMAARKFRKEQKILSAWPMGGSIYIKRTHQEGKIKLEGQEHLLQLVNEHVQSVKKSKLPSHSPSTFLKSSNVIKPPTRKKNRKKRQEEKPKKAKNLPPAHEPRDFTIIVGAETFRVHKFKLMARCETFSEVIKKNPDADELVLEDISVEIFESILNYVYKDEMPKNLERTREIFAAAENLKIERLKENLTEILIQKMNERKDLDFLVENLILGIKFECRDLKLKAFEEFKKHFPLRKFKDELLDQPDKLKLLQTIKNYLENKLDEED